MAILVALLERSIGIQYFRTGQIRKGVVTILFFGQVFPSFLGIVDAVKLALADEGESKQELLAGHTALSDHQEDKKFRNSDVPGRYSN
jgi:hypothetical protein